MERLEAEFAGWYQDIQLIIDRADRGECFRWSLYYRPPIERCKARAAPHARRRGAATLPYLAQGACMAVEDGAVLTRALRRTGDVPEALQIYERNRIERTSRIVKGSGANRDLFQCATKRRCAAPSPTTTRARRATPGSIRLIR